MEKWSIGLERYLCKRYVQSHHLDSWGGCLLWPLYMTCLLWCPGSLNSLNVLNRSLVLQELYKGWVLKYEYVVNGRKYNVEYFLHNGISPSWVTFVKTIPLPQGSKARLLVEHQETVRKDVERALGILQFRVTTIRRPTRNMNKAKLGMIMKACVIRHSMTIKDERDLYEPAFDYDHVESGIAEHNVWRDHHPSNATYFRRVVQIRDVLIRLQSDLMQEMWRR